MTSSSNRPPQTSKHIQELKKVLLEGDRAALQATIIDMAGEQDPEVKFALEEALAQAAPHDKAPEKNKNQDQPALREGMACGPFQIESTLARGGMGTIYLASRRDDLNMKVAVKTLDSWTPEMLVQFRKETKILSTLTHPGIAHLIDAGALPNGQPWLAMEYVEGKTLNKYMEERKLSLNARINLFIKICDALSYAHQQLVVHRDLKPNNIIVKPDGEPKLLDFGIASILDPQNETNPVTLLASRFFTPEYTSPEEVNGLRVNATSDVYSMGLIFYEMLSGVGPYKFDKTTMKSLIRTINEATIPAPSMNPENEKGVKPSLLKGELDTIILKALERDPKQRYHSIEAFSGDLQLYLLGLPISARPATRFYRLRKFIFRNPWPVAAGTGLAVILILFSLYAQMQRSAITLERDAAHRERLISESVTDFLTDLFEQVDPDLVKDGQITAFEVLETGRFQLNQRLDEAPLVRARLMTTMGKVYRSIGHLEQSKHMLQSALQVNLSSEESWATRTQLILTLIEAGDLAGSQEQIDKMYASSDDLDVNTLAMLNYLQGQLWLTRGNPLKASHFLDRSLEPELPTELELAFRKAKVLCNEVLGNFNECIHEMERQLEMERRYHGARHSSVAETLMLLASYYAESDQYDKSAEQLEEAEKMLIDIFGEHHPRLILLYCTWSNLNRLNSNYKEAEQMSQKALGLSLEFLGKEHPITAECLFQLAVVKNYTGEYESSESYMRESINIYRSIFGSRHRKVAVSISNLANLLRRKGEMESARQLGEQALDIFKSQEHPSDPAMANTLKELGDTHLELENYEEARMHLEQAVAMTKETMGEEHHALSNIYLSLGRVFELTDNLVSAERYYKESLNIINKAFGEDSTQASNTIICLANLMWAKGDYIGADPFYRTALSMYKKSLGPDHFFVAISTHNVGINLIELGQWNQAEQIILQSYDIYAAAMGEDHYWGIEPLKSLASVYTEKGMYDKAIFYQAKAMETFERSKARKNVRWVGASLAEGVINLRQGHLQEAEQKIKTLLEGMHVESRLSIYFKGFFALMETYIYQERYSEADQLLNSISHTSNLHFQTMIQRYRAMILHGQGQFEEARTLFETVLADYAKQKGGTHPELAVIKMELAATLHAQGKVKEAATHLSQAQDIFAQMLPPKHEYHLVNLSLKGQNECLQGNKRTGQKQLTEAHQGLEALLGKNHYFSLSAQKRLQACK